MATRKPEVDQRTSVKPRREGDITNAALLELFEAQNDANMRTIKAWIDESIRGHEANVIRAVHASLPKEHAIHHEHVEGWIDWIKNFWREASTSIAKLVMLLIVLGLAVTFGVKVG